MSTTLPGIFSFRAKMAKIFGLKLAHPGVKTQKDANSNRCYKLATSDERELRSTHACAIGQNKANDDSRNIELTSLFGTQIHLN